MLEVLGEELLVEVIKHLPPAALRIARQASRLLDAASRQLVMTLILKPQNSGGESGVPDWSRFPKLRSLRLAPGRDDRDFHEPWEAVHLEGLQECFAVVMPAAAAALSAVETVVVDRGGHDWMHPLWRSCSCTCPAWRALRVNASMSAPLSMARLASLLCRCTPHLEQLCVPCNSINLAAARLLGALPQLARLEFLNVQGHDEDVTEAWAALPLGRLTSLSMYDYPECCLPPTEQLNLSRLVELQGVRLRAGQQTEALARGAPLLRSLEALPEGDWSAPTCAVFARVTHATFWDYEYYAEGFRCGRWQ